MCGYDLRSQPQRRRRFSWIDALLVAAVIAVLFFWWRIGTESARPSANGTVVQAILPTSIPLLAATPTSTPTATPPPTATPLPITTETVLLKHTVKAGETLLSIAIDYNVSVEEIQRANNLSTELIRVGDDLTIPVVREKGGPAASGPTGNFVYTVATGDTLVSIALKFGSSVEDLQVANNLSAGDIIRPGDVLTVPVSGVPNEVLAATPAPTAAAPAANATAAARAVYIEPRLITPSEGATIARTQPILLQWASVDMLKPNEWYVLQILPRSPDAQQLPTAWTKQTSYRLGNELAPAEGKRAEYDWLVSVVQVQPNADGRLELSAVSPPSEVRRFIWQ